MSESLRVRIDTSAQMVSAMRAVQDELAFEVEQLSLENVHIGRIGGLVADTEYLARALRRFGWLAARG
ncbi:hypothetical protein [Saccharopolyspora sp. NPDC002686]|uniref:hypothetical protein n=1 Tax=Saccharopolyspora sp. NPDC002686 TaxID=3154541 RepID=UPI0033340A0D